MATDPGKLKRLIRLAQVKHGDNMCDLGSGDGRLVIAGAQAGAVATGYELNPVLVWWSRWLVRRNKLDDTAVILSKNFWNEDLSPYNVVVVFGVGGKMMAELENKLLKELRPGARVVSNGFKFPNWQVAARDRSLYFYQRT